MPPQEQFSGDDGQDTQDHCTVTPTDVGNVSLTNSEPPDVNNNNSDSSNSWISRKIKKAYRDIIPHGGALSSGVNLASVSLGAGTLGMPSAMAMGGTLFCSLFLCLCCATSVYTIRLLIITVELTGCTTYEEMALVLMGSKFKKLTAGLIILLQGGVTIVYVIAIGDVMAPIMELDWFPDVFKGLLGRRLLTTIFWALFMFPLSLAKEVNTLRYASMIGLMTIVYLAIAIVVHTAETMPREPRPQPQLVTFTPVTILSLPLIIFGFVVHSNCFEIYAELKNKSVNTMTVVPAVSLGLCTTLYIVVGLAGVYNFGDKIRGNILNNYRDVPEKPYLIVAFVAMAVTLTISFPICIFPTRDSVLQLIGYKNAYETPTRARVLVAGSLAVGSLIIGLFVPQMTIMLGLLGSTGGATLSFIWPAIFVLRTGKWNAEHGVSFVSVTLVWALIIGGTLAAVLGTAVSIYQQF